MIKHYDIAVVGGGAAGLFFTALAAKSKSSIKVALIEKNQRVGKKLLVTGNGRCNLTNLYTKSSNYHGSFGSFMEGILEKCPPQKVLELFRELGLYTRNDEHGRVYPKSNQASSVLDVLRFNCEKSNVDFLSENTVLKAEKKDGKFSIVTDKTSLTADKLIIATGGAAAPKSGGDKSGYELLRKLGHSIVKLSPALCPVVVKSEFLKALKGIRVQGEVSLLHDGKALATEIGEIQFTENSLSGICVFNLSQYVNSDSKYTLRLRLMPEYSFREILDILNNNRRIFAELEAENLLTGIFHKRIALAIIKHSKIQLNKNVSDISDKELKTLADKINSFDFEVVGLPDFNNAQVTKGGVKGDEINPFTMESKKVKGLYIIGETIDCNGDCGGYNLQFAFATGYLAARNI